MRQHLVFDLDALGGFFGDFLSFGCDGSDNLAGELRLFVFLAYEIVILPDHLHSRHCLRHAEINTHHLRASVWTSDDLGPEHARPVDIE